MPLPLVLSSFLSSTGEEHIDRFVGFWQQHRAVRELRWDNTSSLPSQEALFYANMDMDINACGLRNNAQYRYQIKQTPRTPGPSCT